MLEYLIIFGAEYLVFVMLSVAFIYWATQKSQKKVALGIFGFIVALSAFIISRLASLLYNNPRPFAVQEFAPIVKHAADNGFPSDHTLLAGTIAVTVYSFNKGLGVSLFLLAIVVGLARVFGGVHHLVDILGSLVIVVGVAFLTKQFIQPQFSNLKNTFIKARIKDRQK
jgi:undecaprenyl-diphosphatase